MGEVKLNKVITSLPTTDLKPPKVKAVKPRGPGGRLLPGYGALNPHGRPPGSRNKLATNFLTDMVKVYEEKGMTILQRCADENPVAFMGYLVKMLPSEILARVDITTNSVLDISVEQRQRIAESWIMTTEEDKASD